MQISRLSINVVNNLVEENEYQARISDFLRHQLQERIENSKEIQSIIDEMDYLEKQRGRTKTKKATKFRFGKLKGFWHSHFFGGHRDEQAANYLKLFDEEGKFEQIFKDSQANANNNEEFTGLMVNAIVDQQYQDNNDNKSWTGHWIIFAKYNGANYYLMLAPHSKRREKTDHLYEKMKTECEAQFPFLFTKN